MKRAKLTGFAVVLFLLTGCASSTKTVGHDFDTSKISRIEKGVTTEDQLVAMLGQPYSKYGGTYTYMYNVVTVKAGSNWFFSLKPKFDVAGHQKLMIVSIRDGVVVNHTYQERPVDKIQMGDWPQPPATVDVNAAQ